MQIKHVDPTTLVPGDNVREDYGDLTSLATSIKAVGVLDPIHVREVLNDDNPLDGIYEIVDGFRRHKAALKAKVAEVPILIRGGVTDDLRDETMLITSLQKKHLNPMEEAKGYARLVGRGMTPANLAKKVGVSKDLLLGRLQLLELPEWAQIAVRDGSGTLAGAELVLKAQEAGLRDELMETVQQRYLDGGINEPIVDTLIATERQERAIAVVQARCDKAGKPLVVRRTYQVPDGVKVIGSGWEFGQEKLDVNEQAHKDEPCFAVFLDAYAPHAKPKALTCCTEPKRHHKTGASDLKVTPARSVTSNAPKPPPANETPEEKESREQHEEQARALKAAADAEFAEQRAKREARVVAVAAKVVTFGRSATATDVKTVTETVVVSYVLDFWQADVAQALEMPIERATTETLWDYGQRTSSQWKRLVAVCAAIMARYSEGYEPGLRLVARQIRNVVEPILGVAAHDLEADEEENRLTSLRDTIQIENRKRQHHPTPVPLADGTFECTTCGLKVADTIEADEGQHLWGQEVDKEQPHACDPVIEDGIVYCEQCGQDPDDTIHTRPLVVDLDLPAEQESEVPA